MKTIWLYMLERAIKALLSYNWDEVVHQVTLLLDENMTGEEKRKRVYSILREMGMNSATWVLNAAIEIAYGKIKESRTPA